MRQRLPFYAVIAGLALLSATLAEPYNISITDQSPTITYLPSRSGDSAETWNSSYTISGSYNSQPGSLGRGDSLHYTTAEGASASVGFVGTAVYVYGYNYGNDTEVQMQVGGEDLERGGEEGLLGWKTGLKNQWWEVALNVTPADTTFRGIDIRRVVFTIDFGGTGATFENTTLTALDENDNPNPQLSFSGSWTTGTEAGIVPITYNRVDTYGQDARIFIPTLSGINLVIIYGSVNDDHGSYFVNPSETVSGWPSMQDFNGSSPWIAIDQVIYFGVIDGGQIVAQNTAGGYWFDVSHIDFITASGGKIENASRTAAIAGGVVGGLAGLALLLAGIWFFWWRRRKISPREYKSGQPDGEGFEIDPYKETGQNVSDSVGGYRDDIEMTYTRTASNSDSDNPLVPRQAPTRPSCEFPQNPPPTIDSPSSSSPGEITPFMPPVAALTANGTQRSHSVGVGERLALVSPEPGTEQAIDLPPPATPAESSRKARRQQRAEAQAGFVQETDAGRVALLPPSYDPAWAQEGLPDAASRTEEDRMSQSSPTAITADTGLNAPEAENGDTQHTGIGDELDSAPPPPSPSQTHTNNNSA